MTSLQRSKPTLKRSRPQFMTRRRGRRCGSDVELALPGMVVHAVSNPPNARRRQSGRRSCRDPRRGRRSARPPDRSTAPAPPSRKRSSASARCAGRPRRRTWSISMGTDRHHVGGRQLDELGRRQRSGVGGRRRRTSPIPRRRHRGRGGSRPPEAVTGGGGPTGGPHRLSSAPSPMRTVPSAVGRRISRISGRDVSATACPGGPTRTPVGRPRHRSSRRR